ncbi:AhpD family alkylhydroperoxidase [Arthrobacter sp. 2762]
MQLNKTIMESATDSGLDERLIEPVKIQAAQLNGCAFCLKLQIRDAIEHGETPDRLAVVPVWWESQYFLEQERAALQIASTSPCSATMGGFLRSASR